MKTSGEREREEKINRMKHILMKLIKEMIRYVPCHGHKQINQQATSKQALEV